LKVVVKLFLALVVLFSTFHALAGEWKQLPSLPDREGFAGSFAGVSNGALLVAGGANLPGKKPWEGGKKVWYDNVFVLESETGEWKNAGELPRPLAYGVSVTYGEGLICVGGSDSDRHYAHILRLEWRDGKLIITGLPPLPQPIANACGALVGRSLYIAGGLEAPDAKETVRRVWRFDLAARQPKWIEVEAWPGKGRMLAVAAGFAEKFWLIGGADLVVGKNGKVQRRCLKDAYRFEPNKGWKRIADLPYPVVAAPSPAPVDATGFYILGGDDCSQLTVAPDQHRGFESTILRYDVATDQWSRAGEVKEPRVTVPWAFWKQSCVVPSGEMRPGVRSPEVWSWSPENKK
jgi:N-acetylneuraminic acid mutarotase